MVSRLSSEMAPMVTRILPSSIWVSLCMSIAWASVASSMKPWLTRK